MALFVAGTTFAQAPQDGRIGYVLTERRWAIFSDDDLDETCPNGFNGGPRDQFTALFPTSEGQQYTELESRLMREGRQAHADTSEDPFPFYDA